MGYKIYPLPYVIIDSLSYIELRIKPSPYSREHAVVRTD